MGNLGTSTPQPTYETTLEGTVIAVSTMRDRGRTQVPPAVKKKLGISNGDSIFWVEANNKIYVTKAKVKLT